MCSRPTVRRDLSVRRSSGLNSTPDTVARLSGARTFAGGEFTLNPKSSSQGGGTSSQIMWRNAQRLRSSWRSIPPVLKATSKAALRVVSPALLNTIVAWRGRRRCRRLDGPLAAKVRPMLYGEEPVEVLSGPFKGMRFAEQSDGPSFPSGLGLTNPNFTRSWELVISAGDYRTIIDVGAAEGYLFGRPRVAIAGGASLCLRHRRFCPSHAAPLGARERHREPEHQGPLLASETYAPIHGQTLIISDIEGCEYELLDPLNCPALTDADILIERHCLPSYPSGIWRSRIGKS